MNENIQNFLDKIAGFRSAYYYRDRQLKELQRYIKNIDKVVNWTPPTIDVGVNQQELIEIDREMLYILAKQLEDKIRKLEIKISQTTISNTDNKGE